MTELKNVDQELGRFRLRLIAAGALVLFGFGLVTARLVTLQVLRHDELSTRAESNRITVLPITPNRGLILDRNGVVPASRPFSGPGQPSRLRARTTPRVQRTHAGMAPRPTGRRAGC